MAIPTPRLKGVPRAVIEQLNPNLPRTAQIKTFYAQLGRAVAAWQLVEQALYEIYRTVTGARRPGAEAAAFYLVPAFRIKLNLTTAAVRFALYDNEKLLETWANIHNRAIKKSQKRNEIAHRAVWI